MSSKIRSGLTYSEAGKLGYEKSRIKREARNKRRKEDYKKTSKKCKFCNKDLPYEKRMGLFCNHSCAASFNNMGICRNQKTYNEKKIKITTTTVRETYVVKEPKFCHHCGKEIEGGGKKYCSLKCQHLFKWGETKNLIKNQGHAKINKIINVKPAKRYLKETRGIMCEICGITKWNNKEVPLVLDHIDGNSDNWKLENLRLICGNCDMQTPTYKGKNKGNGRHYRRVRYKNGQSY